MKIPAIDLQNIDLDELDRACREWGFFTLTGHDISAQLRGEALRMTAEFFHQPKAAKNEIRRTASNCWGYFDTELTKNRQDWKEILDIGFAEAEGPLAGATPQWPDDHQFVECIGHLRQALHDTAISVVQLVVQALGAQLDVGTVFGQHTSFLRLNFYPPCPNPYDPESHGSATQAGELGISHHTDAGAVTVLLQDDQPGLQVLHQGQWQSVPPQPEALIINIGDIVQVWSNDRYPAPLHRVLANSSQQRISTPYFLNPSYAYDYAPLVNDDAAHYRDINWGEFRAGRAAGDYADYGTEIQIEHFRIP